MIDRTLYLAGLALGADHTALVMHLVAALVPAVFIGWAAIKGNNKFLATVGFVSLNALAFCGAGWFTDGGYNYWLYTLCLPLHDAGYAAMASPTFFDSVMLYLVPALIHGLLAPLIGAAALAVARSAKR